jgi:hypothetical protein
MTDYVPGNMPMCPKSMTEGMLRKYDKNGILLATKAPEEGPECLRCEHHKGRKTFKESCSRINELLFKGGDKTAAQLMQDTAKNPCPFFINKLGHFPDAKADVSPKTIIEGASEPPTESQGAKKITTPYDSVAPESEIPDSANMGRPACTGEPDTYECCPDLRVHIVKDPIRGRCCEILNLPCNQLPKSGCPIDTKEKREKALKFTMDPAAPKDKKGQSTYKTEFTTTHLIDATREETHDIDNVKGGKVIPGVPYKIMPAPKTDAEANELFRIAIYGNWTKKDQEAIERLVDLEELGDNYNSVLHTLVWNATERIGD